MKGITLRDYIDMYCHFCWEMSIAANALVNLFLFVCLFLKKIPWNLKKKEKKKRGGGAVEGNDDSVSLK